MRRLRLYNIDDGLKEYTVAARRRSDACKVLGVTESYQRVNGDTLEIGKMAGTDVVANHPGELFWRPLFTDQPWSRR